jgi:D-glycero-alpha-D-manno-heptose-7-phosphate kinase
VLIRSRAPLRISFAGGGTDLSPFVDQHGGAVLNATIDRYAYATLRTLPEKVIRVNSLDYEAIEDFGMDLPLIHEGNLSLVKACIERFRRVDDEHGLELYLETEAPPSSGLGASSALAVAVLGALTSLRRESVGKYEMARLAWEVERSDVGIPGGQQDQYAAVFGGFNFIEFKDAETAVVNPLRVDRETVAELEYNIVLFFTGGSRISSEIIQDQISGYEKDVEGVRDALMEMKSLAVAAKEAILKGRLADLGEILDADWQQKKRTSDGVTTPIIEELYAEARRLGALGGKVSGAGGGGFMFLYCPFDRKPAVVERLTQMGAQVFPVTFESAGMRSWHWEH